MDTKFLAEWIEKQSVDEFGDWNPDCDEYRSIACASLEGAKATAIRESRRCGVGDWVRVTECVFNPTLGIPRRSDAAWDVSRVWHGDWEGNWNEDRS